MSSKWKKLSAVEKDAYRKDKREHFGAVANLAKALQERAKVSPEDKAAVDKAIGTFRMYSPTNAMLIFVQKHDATLVAGFHDWRKHGRKVRKGEHGLSIWIPLGLNKKSEPDAIEEPTGFALGTVFDISQTEPLVGDGNV